MTTTITVKAGPMTHGGACVCHHHNKVGFIRNAIPGETVKVLITQELSKRFYGTVIDVVEASEHRREHFWPEAVNNDIGGTEYGHIALDHQRYLKAEVLRDAFSRVGGRDLAYHMDGFDIPFYPAPSDAAGGCDAGRGWRTRVEVVMTSEGIGMHQYRGSHCVPVKQLPFVSKKITDCDIFGAHCALAKIAQPGQRIRLVHDNKRVVACVDDALFEECDGVFVPTKDDVMHYRVGDDLFDVSALGFWQAHTDAPCVLRESVTRMINTVRAHLAPSQISAVEFYAGAGLLSLELLRRCHSVWTFEGSVRAVADAKKNMSTAGLTVEHAGRAFINAKQVARAAQRIKTPDLVVLDPPRQGAGTQMMKALAQWGPSAIILVACDLASAARDLGVLHRCQYRITQAECHDLFPYTPHIESVFLLERGN
ncbi:MAG: RsmD family RNA methyltransferase [Actinomycetaceae bacterium]|nr:RsmD family RNA methyltransferase [Actinomycetaceae bacterium]